MIPEIRDFNNEHKYPSSNRTRVSDLYLFNGHICCKCFFGIMLLIKNTFLLLCASLNGCKGIMPWIPIYAFAAFVSGPF